MKGSSRVKSARRYLGISQTELAAAVGVQRSAVSHWESPAGKSPTVKNLSKIAEATGVHFEWLATGRGVMTLSDEDHLESVAAAHALLVEDPLEMRMIEGLRAVNLKSRLLLVEMGEQLAGQHTGSVRPALQKKRAKAKM